MNTFSLFGILYDLMLLAAHDPFPSVVSEHVIKAANELTVHLSKHCTNTVQSIAPTNWHTVSQRIAPNESTLPMLVSEILLQWKYNSPTLVLQCTLIYLLAYVSAVQYMHE